MAEVTGASGKDLKEDDEFRQWQEEQQRKEEEEKFRRFKMRQRESEKVL